MNPHLETAREIVEDNVAGKDFNLETTSDIVNAIAAALEATESRLHAAHQEHLKGIREAILGPHDKEGAGYCDTGEDMGMACRSECVKLAVKRFDTAARLDAKG